MPAVPEKRYPNTLDFWTDQNLLPSKTDKYWLIYGKWGNIHGKWMLFFDKSIIDTEWSRFKKLYNECKLGDVISMKVSGAKINPRASNKEESVIIIYCPNNESKINEIGKIIISNLENYNKPFIYYKSDDQTALGTRATGSIHNHKYKLSVPKKSMSNQDELCLFTDD